MTKDEFCIEIEGITYTIKNYTREHYIYINLLYKSGQEDNIVLIPLLLERLIKWYSENIKTILHDQFVYNKDSHIKNISTLKRILQ